MVWMESLNRVKTRKQVLPPGIQAVGQQWKEKLLIWRRRQKPWADPNSRINTVIESSKTSINQLLHQTFHSNSNWTVVNHIEDVNPSLGQAAHTLKRRTKQFEWICPSNCCVARRKKSAVQHNKTIFVLLLIVFAKYLSHVGKEEGEDVSMRSWVGINLTEMKWVASGQVISFYFVTTWDRYLQGSSQVEKVLTLLLPIVATQLALRWQWWDKIAFYRRQKSWSGPDWRLAEAVVSKTNECHVLWWVEFNPTHLPDQITETNPAPHSPPVVFLRVLAEGVRSEPTALDWGEALFAPASSSWFSYLLSDEGVLLSGGG